LLDGIVIEKLGLPTAVVITEPFISSGKAVAVSHGIADYPFVVIPHPIAATETETLHHRAEQIVDQVASIWLEKVKQTPDKIHWKPIARCCLPKSESSGSR
jgi:hypothetical protein